MTLFQKIAAVLAALLTLAAIIIWWTAEPEEGQDALDAAIQSSAATARETSKSDLRPPPAPEASEEAREAKRFRRYDRNKNAEVDRDEYLYSRRRSFAKMDTNGDGRIDFDEYAVKQNARFDNADADGSGVLIATEFVATRTRSYRPKPKAPECPPA